ncbi:MAG: SufE family protein [Gammaproteobacteria bacterium]|nr:SufE family protein [Gammaproteobacteria bacterium]
MNEVSTTSSTDEIQNELIEEFAFFDDWTDRYQYLIDLGRELPTFPAEAQTEANRLHGCQSNVWLLDRTSDDHIQFQAISDSAIVSGLIALILRVYNGRTAQEILATEPRFVAAIGLDSHLSPTRKNGLHAMLEAIRERAAARLDGPVA